MFRGVLFVIVNSATPRRGALRGIHATARRPRGRVPFPLAFLPALAVCWPADPGRLFALQLAFLILAFADPLASVVGMRLRSQRGEEALAKSVAGSTAFFVTSLLLSLGALLWFRAEQKIDWSGGEVVVAAVVVALVTTAGEGFGRRGGGNFFIVPGALVGLGAFYQQPGGRPVLRGAVAADVEEAIDQLVAAYPHGDPAIMRQAAVLILDQSTVSTGPTTVGTFERGEVAVRLGDALSYMLQVERILLERNEIYPCFTLLDPSFSDRDGGWQWMDDEP